jgi:L-amino acid N-acyltransferase YncA
LRRVLAIADKAQRSRVAGWRLLMGESGSPALTAASTKRKPWPLASLPPSLPSVRRHVERVLIRHADPARDGAACERIARAYPWLIADEGGEVAGYAYSDGREHAAYRWTAYVTVYIAPAFHRRIRSAVHVALLGLFLRQRLYVVRAGVTLPNEASVGLHGALRFTSVGVYRDVSWKSAPGTTSAGGSCCCVARIPRGPLSRGRPRAFRRDADELVARVPLYFRRAAPA